MPGILSPLSKTAQVFCVSLFFLMGVDLIRASPNIIISEIHFNPNGPDEAREFIEIKNVGQEIVDLSGWKCNANNKKFSSNLGFTEIAHKYLYKLKLSNILFIFIKVIFKFFS